MKTQKKLLKLGLALALTSLVGTVANADTVNGTATAIVIAPLSIAETTAMDFGTISGGLLAAGTVVLDNAGARTVTGEAQIIAANPGAAGVFTIMGEASQAYNLTFSASGTLSDGSNTMTANTFTNNAALILPAATEVFQVGATLNVIANQPAGNYSTVTAGGLPFTVTVNYN